MSAWTPSRMMSMPARNSSRSVHASADAGDQAMRYRFGKVGSSTSARSIASYVSGGAGASSDPDSAAALAAAAAARAASFACLASLSV